MSVLKLTFSCCSCAHVHLLTSLLFLPRMVQQAVRFHAPAPATTQAPAQTPVLRGPPPLLRPPPPPFGMMRGPPPRPPFGRPPFDPTIPPIPPPGGMPPPIGPPHLQVMTPNHAYLQNLHIMCCTFPACVFHARSHCIGV